MRAFMAVEITEPVRAALAREIESLRRAADPVKWVEPQNIHLTVKFLGDVPDDKIAVLAARARECCARFPACDLELKGAGAFPNMGRPRVIFVDGADQPPVLADLAAALDDAMTEFGIAREERGFRCHITLGRVRMPRPAPDLAEKLRKMQNTSFGIVPVKEVVLMKSDLTPRGPIYTPVDRFPLGITA